MWEGSESSIACAATDHTGGNFPASRRQCYNAPMSESLPPDVLRENIQVAIADIDRGKGAPLDMDAIKAEVAENYSNNDPS